MVLVSNFYLSRIIGSRVFATRDNSPIGHVADLIADLTFHRPKVVAIRLRSGETLDISTIDIVKDGRQYAFYCNEVHPFTAKPDNLIYLRRNIQDRQIVDMDGRKVVRVNDLRLAVVADGTYLIAVDVGLEGLLRRLGVARPISHLLRAFHRSLPSRLILWDDVQAVDAGTSGIQLSKESSRISTLHPSDIADIIEDLDTNSQSKVFNSLDEEKAADVLEEMEPETQVHILDGLTIAKAADVLEKMPSDEVADIMGVLDRDVAEQLFAEMDKDTSREVRELMEFPENTAGSMMSTDYIALTDDMSASAVLENLRREKPEMDTIFYCYVLDGKGRLIATVSLRDLLICDPDTPVRSIMNRDFLYAYDDDSVESLAGIFEKYSLLAVPVVNRQRIMEGIVVVSDIVYDLTHRRKRLVG